jgi:hypothetical protein
MSEEKKEKTKEKPESEKEKEEDQPEEKEKKKEPEEKKEKSKDSSEDIIKTKAKAIADRILKNGSLGTPIFPSPKGDSDSPPGFSQMQKKIDELTRDNERMAQRLQQLDTEKAKDLQVKIARITQDWEKPLTEDEMEDWTFPETQSVFEFVQRYKTRPAIKTAKDEKEKPGKKIKKGFLPIIPPVKQDEVDYDPSGHTFFIEKGKERF